MLKLSKTEAINFIFTVLVLAIVFGYNDGRPVFEFSFWITNFFKVLVIAAISIYLHNIAHKYVAKRYGLAVEHRVWGIKKLSLAEPKYPKKISIFGKKFVIESFPLGIILPILFAIFTNGRFYFATVESYKLFMKRISRFGKRFIHVTDFEEAKIAIAGPLVNIFIAIAFSTINFNGMFDSIVLINSWIALFHMLPFPELDGFKVLVGSVPIYIFSFVFILCVTLFMKFIGSFGALLLALLLAILLVFLFFWRLYK